MKKCMVLMVAVLAMSVAAQADWTTAESWENDLGSWGGDMSCFDAYQFVASSDPLYGSAVTDGDYALSLNCKEGWQQGLQSDYGIDQGFVDAMSTGVTKVKMDVTSSQELSGYYGQGGSFQLALYMQGEVMIDGVSTPIGDYVTGTPPAGGYGVTFSYNLINPPYSYVLETVECEWDLTNGGAWNGLPEFDPADGGWFQIRIHTNVNGWGDPGWIIIDNLQAYSEGGQQYGQGDFNADDSVTGADYVVWANNFGGSDEVLADGSHNDDGSVTGADYVIWANNFGNDYSTSTVPEPATLALLGLGAAAIIRRRK